MLETAIEMLHCWDMLDNLHLFRQRKVPQLFHHDGCFGVIEAHGVNLVELYAHMCRFRDFALGRGVHLVSIKGFIPDFFGTPPSL